MEYLNNLQVIDAVKDYLLKAPYNYAFMIDGEWGTGKSYMVKNELTKAIEEIEFPQIEELKKSDSRLSFKVINISLYGISDLSSLSRQISTSILYSNKILKSKSGEMAKKIAPIAGAALRMVTDIFLAPISKSDEGFQDLFTDVIQNFSKMSSFVLIFDDLERCTIPVVEVFGFISNLIEINSVKTIIVANEKEIKDVLSSENLHQKYLDLVSVADKMKLPEVNAKRVSSADLFQSANPNTTDTNDLMNVEDLKFIVNKIFPPDENYRRFKEKVVGQTVTYRPDLEKLILPLMDSIFKSMEFSYQDSTFVSGIMPKTICDTFHQMKYYNLRTIQMLLKNLGLLLPITLPIVVKKFDREDPYTLREIVTGVTNIAIRYSKGMAYEDIDIKSAEQGIYTNGPGKGFLSFRFAADYFYYGIFNEKYIRDVLVTTTELFWKDSRNPESPLQKLSTYHVMNEDEALQYYSNLRDEFYSDKYEYSEYPIILRILLDMSDVGLVQQADIEDIVDRMCENVFEINVSPLTTVVYPLTNQSIESYRNYIQRIEIASNIGQNKSLGVIIAQTLLDNTLCSQEIKSFYLDLHYSGNDQTSYFLLADLNKVLSVLKASTSQEIYDFRIILSEIYSDDITKTLKSEKSIREFSGLLAQALASKENQFFDLIAKKQATWLKGDLERYLSKYPQKGSNLYQEG